MNAAVVNDLYFVDLISKGFYEFPPHSSRGNYFSNDPGAEVCWYWVMNTPPLPRGHYPVVGHSADLTESIEIPVAKRHH